MMNGFEDQIRQIVEEWPGEGYVVGVLPDPSDPEWSGRSVLELIEAADRSGGPSVVVDLARETTDLAARFEAGRGQGLAELAAGEAELWEIAHRSDEHRAVYLGAGSGEAGSGLAGSAATAELAGKMSERGRLLLVVLDRAAVKAAASAGYLDGLVKIGEADGAGDVEGVPELGRITARPGGRRPVPDREDGPRLVLPPEMRTERRRKRRIRRALVGLAALIALLLVASSFLGGPDIGELLPGSDSSSSAVDRAVPRQQASPPAAAAATADSTSAVPAGSTDSAAPASTSAAASDASAADSAAPSAIQRSGDNGGDRAGSERESPVGEPGGLASEPAEADSAASPEADPESGGPPAFRAVADSLAVSINDFVRQAGRFRGGEVGCGELIEARRRVDRLFERLWMERMSLQPSPDSPAAATFRERSRQMETVERAYRATSCPAAAVEGS